MKKKIVILIIKPRRKAQAIAHTRANTRTNPCVIALSKQKIVLTNQALAESQLGRATDRVASPKISSLSSNF